VSTVLTKAKSPDYSQVPNKNKIYRQGVKIQRIRQADSQTVGLMVDGVHVWCLDGEVGMGKRME